MSLTNEERELKAHLEVALSQVNEAIKLPYLHQKEYPIRGNLLGQLGSVMAILNFVINKFREEDEVGAKK